MVTTITIPVRIVVSDDDMAEAGIALCDRLEELLETDFRGCYRDTCGGTTEINIRDSGLGVVRYEVVQKA